MRRLRRWHDPRPTPIRDSAPRHDPGWPKPLSQVEPTNNPPLLLRGDTCSPCCLSGAGGAERWGFGLAAARARISVQFLVMGDALQPSDQEQPNAGDMIRRIPQGLVGISPFRLYGWGCCAGSAHGDQNLHGANRQGRGRPARLGRFSFHAPENEVVAAPISGNHPPNSLCPSISLYSSSPRPTHGGFSLA